MGAGVVGADVAGFGAEAARAVALGARRDRPPGDIREAFGIDAGGQLQARTHEVRLGAERGLQAQIPRDRRELGQERAFIFVGRIDPGESVALGGAVQVVPGLGIDLSEGEHHLVGLAGELAGERREISPVPCRCRHRGDQYRIVAPDRGARPVSPVDFPDQRHTALRRQHRSLQRARIAGRGDLDREGNAAPRDLPQRGAERPRIAGPEHEARDRVRRERDISGPGRRRD